MADFMSILSSAYKSDVLSTARGTSKYVPVDASLYEGSWSGTYSDGKKFSLSVSQVSGFRAQVHYESAGTSQFQQVLIKDNSFRFGNTRFTLTAVGKAQVDSEIAAVPAFAGPSGKFDQTVYEQAIARQRLTDRDLGERATVEQRLEPGARRDRQMMAAGRADL